VGINEFAVSINVEVFAFEPNSLRGSLMFHREKRRDWSLDQTAVFGTQLTGR
jgi:hypothetical protein